MARRRFIFDRETRKMVEIGTETQVSGGTQIVGDIEPYRNVIDGKWITSRSEHREFLRRNGCQEVGNERYVKPRQKTQQEKDDFRREMRHDIRVAERLVRDGLAPTLQQLRERGLAE